MTINIYPIAQARPLGIILGYSLTTPANQSPTPRDPTFTALEFSSPFTVSRSTAIITKVPISALG